MKVCIITNLYPPNARGGAEQVVSKTVDGLMKQGHDVVVITTTPERVWTESKDKLTIYRFRPWNLYYYTDAHKFSGIMRFFWHLINIFHIDAAAHVKQILKKEKPDVVHTHNLMGLSFLIPRVIRKLKLRHLHTIHDVQLVEPSGIILKSKEGTWRYNGLHTDIYSWLTKKLFGSPDVIISPSKFLFDFYSSRGFFPNSKHKVLRNPIPFSLTQTNRNDASRPFSFLYVGQIEDHKGIVFLVDAFRQMLNLDAHLHVAGSGSAFAKVKALAEGDVRIHIYGRVDRDKVADLFNSADVTIVPSRCYENSPTVIFESFYFGVPVLASNIEGIAELITEGENGATFVADDIDSLKNKIRWCADSKDELLYMAGKTRDSLKGLGEEEFLETLVGLYLV
jgi:glycosyltransferase involved in cell wall biosynthesis